MLFILDLPVGKQFSFHNHGNCFTDLWNCIRSANGSTQLCCLFIGPSNPCCLSSDWGICNGSISVLYLMASTTFGENIGTFQIISLDPNLRRYYINVYINAALPLITPMLHRSYLNKGCTHPFEM